MNPSASTHPSLAAKAQRARRLFRFTVLSRTLWITGFGMGSMVMGLLITAAAFNTGTNLLYVMLSLLIALFTLSLGLGWLNLNGLQVERIAPTESHAGETASFQTILRNRKRWMTSYGVSVEERAREMEPDRLSAYFLSAPARGVAVQPQQVTFKRRGIYQLEGVQLGTLFPFGMVEFRSRQSDPVEFLVFPQLLPLGEAPRHLSLGTGEEEHPDRGHASGLHSIRDYMPGDPARDIHWRLSAKGTGLKLREYESESAEGVQIVLDIGTEREPTPEMRENMERAISLSASLARHYIRNDIEVTLWTRAGQVPRGNGPAHLRRIYRSLALLEFEQLQPNLSLPGPSIDLTQVIVQGGAASKEPSAATRGRKSLVLSAAAPPPLEPDLAGAGSETGRG